MNICTSIVIVYGHVLQEVTDPIGQQLGMHSPYDEHRAHENFVLSWLTSSLGFTKLYTEFDIMQSNLTASESHLPDKVVSIADTHTTWSELFTGQTTLHDLFQEGETSVFACPEATHKACLSMARCWQENIIMMHQTDREFRYGLLFNVHRFPLSGDGGEDVDTGMHFYSHPFLDVHSWPLIDYVMVLAPTRTGQFSGSHAGVVTRSSYYCVIVYSSQNATARQLLSKMVAHDKHAAIHADHIIHKWGVHKADLSYLGQLCMDKLDLRLPLWFYTALTPPLCKLACPDRTLHTVEIAGPPIFRASIDYPARYDDEFYMLIKSYKGPPQLSINMCMRQSYGSRIWCRTSAYDLFYAPLQHEMESNTAHANSHAAFLDLWTFMESYNPLMGYYNQLHLMGNAVTGLHTVFIEVGSNKVFWELMKADIISWVLMVAPNWAACTGFGDMPAADPEGLCELISSIETYNKQLKAEWGHKVDKEWFVNTVVVSQHPDVLGPIMTSGLVPMEGCVAYDRHRKHHSHTRSSTFAQAVNKPDMTVDTGVVVLSCQHLNYVSDRSKQGARLEEAIASVLQKRGYPGIDRMTLKVTYNSMTSCYLQTDPDTAFYLVKQVQHMDIRQDGTTAHVKFTSIHYKLTISEIEKSLATLAITDRTSGDRSATRDSWPTSSAPASASASSSRA